ncbi:hypothetical protein [Solimonas soli]|uniref:hypothetical protein n=1 Tax=Solimonas soli TaxID=413479 RepID=UPI0012FB980A|nr:hypothetical protein [Solimonas soli]
MLIAWFILITAGFFSTSLGFVGVEDRFVIGISLILIGFAKSALLMWEFMEVRNAPAIIKGIGCAWIVLTATLLSILFSYPDLGH